MWRILKVLILKSCWFATDSIIIIITIDNNSNNNNHNNNSNSKTSFLNSLPSPGIQWDNYGCHDTHLGNFYENEPTFRLKAVKGTISSQESNAEDNVD